MLKISGLPWRAKVAIGRESLEHALAEWGAARARYWELKKAQWANSEGAKHWKEKLAAYEERLKEARSAWRELVRGLESFDGEVARS